MNTPIIILSGSAYSGKGTAAGIIAGELTGAVISLADPIKRFLADPEGYGLTEAQLWGAEKEKEFTRRDPSHGVLVQLAEAHFGIADPDMVDTFADALNVWRDGLPMKTTGRHLMQTLGTECVRKNIDDDFWIDFGMEIADVLLREPVTYDRVAGVVDAEGPCNAVVIEDGRFRNEILPVLTVGGVALRIERPMQGIMAKAAAAHASETQQRGIPSFWFTDVLRNDKGLDDFKKLVKNWTTTQFFL